MTHYEASLRDRAGARGLEGRLPGREGRSLAEVWGLTPDQVRRTYTALKLKPLKPSAERRLRKKLAQPSKIKFAGYDETEVQVKWVSK